MATVHPRDGTSLTELTRSTSLVNHAAGHQPRFGAVSLGRRVRHWLDATPAGLALDLLSSALSVLVISVYIVATYLESGSWAYNQLRHVELACCCWFAAEWLLRLWTANDRLRYLVSLQSLVDLLTVLPLFLTYIWDAATARGTHGIDFFLALVRFLRVLRIFRLFQLGSRVSSEVNSRLMALACTLLSLIMISASLFLEIETTFGDKYPDLRYHEAIYWSVVTATTIGYGDYSPSTPASQMALLGMLLVTFTLLPYQTSMLVTAMGYSSGYQRAAYSAAAHGRHILLLGSLHAPRLRTLLEQLFHPDYGFQDHQVVLLNKDPPDEEVRHVLKHHPNSHRLFYIQGDPFNHLALDRAQAAVADAIFVLTPELTPDPAGTDLQATMLMLRLGHAVQRRQLQMSPKTRRPIAAELAAALWWFLRWLQPGKHNTAIPRVYLQLALPASQQHAQQLLASMFSCSEPGSGAGPLAEGLEQGSDAYGSMTGIAEEQHSWPSDTQPEATAGTAAAAATTAAAAATLRAVPCMRRGWRQWSWRMLAGSLCRTQPPDPRRTFSRPALMRQTSSVHGFWRTFASGVTIMSRMEVQASLLGLAATGGCAVLPLLSNLVRSVDAGDMTEPEFKALPDWLQQYLEGSAMELYEVAAFPSHLAGQPFTTVARYLLDVHHALLLALVPSGKGMKAPDVGPRCLLAPVAQHVPSGCRGYIIASDLRVAADIAEADVRVFEQWGAEWLQLPEELIQADILLGQHSDTQQQVEAGGVGRSAERVAVVKSQAALDGSDSDSGVSAASAAAGTASAACQPGSLGLPPSDSGSHLSTSGFSSSRPPLPTKSALSLPHCTSSMALPPAGSSQGSLGRPSMKYTAPSVPRASSRSQLLGAGPLGVPGQCSLHALSRQPSPGVQYSSRGCSPRTTVEDADPQAVQVEGVPGTWIAAPDTTSHAGAAAAAPGESTPAGNGQSPPGDLASSGFPSGRSGVLSGLAGSTGRALASPLLAAAAALSLGGGTAAAAGGALRKRHRSSCLYHTSSNTSFLQAWGGPGLAEGRGEQQPLYTGLPWAPAAVEQLEHLYYTWPCPEEEQVQVQQVDAYTMGGHVLVVLGCGPVCPDVVFSLLAPLRSRSLLEVRPVVLLSQEPLQGPQWSAVARLRDVVMVQGAPSSLRDLVCANVAAAELALVMPSAPQGSGPSEEGEEAAQHRQDMEAAAMVHLLKAAAPGCQVVACLHSPSSALWLDPTGWLLAWQPEEGTCQVLPAAMCGQLLLPQVLDCTLCQTHFNGFTWPLMQQLLVSWHSRAGFGSSHGTRGDTRRTAATTDLAVTSAYQAQPVHVDDSSSRGAVLLQLPVVWPGWVYGDLFTHLLCERGWLPLALYRRAGHRGRQLPYVYTNPGRHTLLQAGDQVVVLVPLDPDTGSLPKEALLALHAQCHSSSSRDLPGAAADLTGCRQSMDEADSCSDAAQGHQGTGTARRRWQSAARRVLTKLHAGADADAEQAPHT